MSKRDGGIKAMGATVSLCALGAIVAVCAAGMTSGCSRKGNNASEAVTAPPPVQPAEPAKTLVGRWDRTCTAAERLGLSEGQSLKITADSTVIERVTTSYAREDCTEPMIKVVEKGRLELGDENAPLVFNATYATIEVTAESDNGKKLLEGIDACEIYKWEIGKVEDVTAKTGILNCWERTPRTVYDIYTLQEDRLYLGRRTPNLNAAAADARPVEVNKDVFYQRVSE